MSLTNIIVTADKTEFTNFFREPLILPVNAEISLVKSNLTLPIYRQQQLIVPLLTAAERVMTFVEISIDGITQTFTWIDFYNAWAGLQNNPLDQQATTQDTFFSGIYPFFINNPFVAENTGTDVYVKTSFVEAFAKMVEIKYKFYKIYPKHNYKASSANVLETDLQDVPVSWRPALGIDKVASYPVKDLGWGIMAEYISYGFTQLDAVDLNIQAADIAVWTTTPTSFTSAGGGVAGTIDNVYINNRNPIDPNGGWLQFKPNMTENDMMIGVSVSTGNIGAAGNNQQNSILPINPPLAIIDFGIKISDTLAGPTYQVIDGYKEIPIAHGNNTVNGVISTLKPIVMYRAYDDNSDYFYIKIHRAGTVSPSSYKYILSLWRTDGAATASEPTADGVLLYQTERVLSSPAISCTPIFLSDGSGNEILDIKVIDATLDSFQQGEAEEGAQSTIQIISSDEIERNTESIRADLEEFYRIIGIQSHQSENDYHKIADSNLSSNNKLSLNWFTDFRIEDQDITTIIGESRLDKLVTMDEFAFVGGTPNAITSLPRQLEVRILDLPLKNVSGSAPPSIKIGTATAIEYDTSTLDKIVGTIPLDQTQIVDDNFDWVCQYEPFTPIYRPLNNPNPLVCSQLQLEITYRDFITGRKMQIPYIPGTVHLELAVRSGRKPANVVNDLRPF